MKPSRLIFLWLFPAVVFFLGSTLVDAQISPGGSAVTIRGKVTSLSGQDLLVTTASGEARVKVPDTTTFRGEVPIKLSDIAPGMYIGASSVKQPDGTYRAASVHVFPEAQRGLNEGHRPQTSIPNRTMTNANVEKVDEIVVQDVKGRMLTLKHKGGEVKVLVPPDAAVVKRVSATRELLKPGAEVTIQATQASDGSVSASQITVRADGILPPT